MPLFIKTEKFTKNTMDMLQKEKKKYLIKHKDWIISLVKSGINIFSGYLTNEDGNPGGGGVVILEANNLEEARFLIMQDPMIKNNLVYWEINEWVPVSGDFSYKFT